MDSDKFSHLNVIWHSKYGAKANVIKVRNGLMADWVYTTPATSATSKLSENQKPASNYKKKHGSITFSPFDNLYMDFYYYLCVE